MSFELERKNIEERFKAMWGSKTRIAWENVAFKHNEKTPWVRLTIIDGEGDNKTIGSPDSILKRYPGLIIVQIFVPDGSGTSLARTYCDDVKEIFSNKEFDSIRCRLSSIQKPNTASSEQREIANVWYQINVVTPFTRDEY